MQSETDINELETILNDVIIPQALCFAGDVDSESRFPFEVLAVLKENKFLSAGNHKKFNGRNLHVMQQAALCRRLAHACASSAMVLGMHFIKCNALNRWATSQPYFADYLLLQHDEQRLIASMTSEEGIGGDLRHSQAAVMVNESEFSIEKSSPCLSYVNEADDILLTCRANEKAASSDQRLVLLKNNQMQKKIGRLWDAMGMRGTCSHACVVSGQANVEQIVETPFALIANQGMIPDAHLIWSSIWLGIAEDAYYKAKKVSRKQFLNDEGNVSGSARLQNEMQNLLLAIDSQISQLGMQYVHALNEADDKFLRSSEFAIKVNSLKLNASSLTKEICLKALEVCGIAGYKNDDELSVSRNIRDVLSAGIMVSNERLISVNAARLML